MDVIDGTSHAARLVDLTLYYYVSCSSNYLRSCLWVWDYLLTGTKFQLGPILVHDNMQDQTLAIRRTMAIAYLSM